MSSTAGTTLSPGTAGATAAETGVEQAEPKGSTPRALRLSLGTSVLTLLLSTISGIELARGLGLENRGLLAAAILWPTVIGAIATLGIEESLTYHVARTPERANALIGSGIALAGLEAAVFTALTAAVVPIVLTRHGDAAILDALVYTVYVPLNLVSVGLNGVLNGLHRYSWCNGVRLNISVLIVGVQTALLAAGHMTVRNVVIGMALCYVVNAIVVYALVRRAQPGPLTVDRGLMRAIFGYGIRSHTSTIPAGLNQRLDQLVISIFLSARQLSLYVTAVTLTTMAGLIGGSVAYATLPNVAGLPEGPQRVVLARRIISGTLLMSIAFAAPTALLAPQLIELFFGHAFVPAADVMRILALASIAFAVNRAIEAVLRGIGRPLAAGASELIALGSTVVGLAVLLPALDLIGAGLTSLIAYLVAGAWMARRVTRVLPLRVTDLLIPDRDAVAQAASRLRGVRRRGRNLR